MIGPKSVTGVLLGLALFLGPQVSVTSFVAVDGDGNVDRPDVELDPLEEADRAVYRVQVPEASVSLRVSLNVTDERVPCEGGFGETLRCVNISAAFEAPDSPAPRVERAARFSLDHAETIHTALWEEGEIEAKRYAATSHRWLGSPLASTERTEFPFRDAVRVVLVGGLTVPARLAVNSSATLTISGTPGTTEVSTDGSNATVRSAFPTAGSSAGTAVYTSNLTTNRTFPKEVTLEVDGEGIGVSAERVSVREGSSPVPLDEWSPLPLPDARAGVSKDAWNRVPPDESTTYKVAESGEHLLLPISEAADLTMADPNVVAHRATHPDGYLVGGTYVGLAEAIVNNESDSAFISGGWNLFYGAPPHSTVSSDVLRLALRDDPDINHDLVDDDLQDEFPLDRSVPERSSLPDRLASVSDLARQAREDLDRSLGEFALSWDVLRPSFVGGDEAVRFGFFCDQPVENPSPPTVFLSGVTGQVLLKQDLANECGPSGEREPGRSSNVLPPIEPVSSDRAWEPAEETASVGPSTLRDEG